MRKDAGRNPLVEIAPPYLKYHYFREAHRESFRFRPEATGLNLVNAWWLCEASILSYSDEKSVKKEFAHIKPDFKVKSFSGRSTQCYVASNDGFLILVFRGTEIWGREGETNLLNIIKAVLADVITDARVRLVASGQGGKVHQGFKGALDEVWEKAHLVDYLKSNDRDGRTFWFTGHSLGAALASLAWKRYTSLGNSVPHLYTFGSPRVGDGDFGKGFRQTYRFVNNNDIVTKVPPPLGYQHVGDRLRFNPEGFLEPGARATEEVENGPEAGNWSWLASREGLTYFYDLMQKAIMANVPRSSPREEIGKGFTTLVPRALLSFNTLFQRVMHEIPARFSLPETVRTSLVTLIPGAILDHVPILYAHHLKKNIP